MMKVRNLCGAMAALVVFGVLFFACDHDGNNNNNSKPDPLSSSASVEEARAKRDEIISYCNSHPTENNRIQCAGMEVGTSGLTGISDWLNPGYQALVISTINSCISYLD